MPEPCVAPCGTRRSTSESLTAIKLSDESSNVVASANVSASRSKNSPGLANVPTCSVADPSNTEVIRIDTRVTRDPAGSTAKIEGDGVERSNATDAPAPEPEPAGPVGPVAPVAPGVPEPAGPVGPVDPCGMCDAGNVEDENDDLWCPDIQAVAYNGRGRKSLSRPPAPACGPLSVSLTRSRASR